MFTVRVGTPDPRFGNMLLEQFGGANGELAAAMQYSIQGLNCDDPGLKDLLMDIGTEELSHLEVIGTLAKLHLKPTKKSREAAETNKSFGSHFDIRHFAYLVVRIRVARGSRLWSPRPALGKHNSGCR
jgi:Mn-containing catalase